MAFEKEKSDERRGASSKSHCNAYYVILHMPSLLSWQLRYDASYLTYESRNTRRRFVKNSLFKVEIVFRLESQNLRWSFRRASTRERINFRLQFPVPPPPTFTVPEGDINLSEIICKKFVGDK